MKACTRCGIVKPLHDYSPCRGSVQAQCKACYAEKRAIWRRENPEAYRASLEANRAAKPWIKHYAANREQESRRKAEAYVSDPKVRERLKKYSKENPDVRRAITARRRAQNLKATPPWADADRIKEFYVTADALGMWTGEWHEVDHIVPLVGKIVCGLHCENNLQVIPRQENRKKGNSWRSI